jgi:peptidoglycan hydrolase FlgJ
MRIDKPSMPPMRETPVDRESPLWQAAEGMEANFLKEMLRNMRKTVQENPEMKNNQGFQVFRGMLDDHYAETAAKTQGIGLAELIVNQVIEMQNPQQPKAPEVREINKNDIVRE